MSSSKECEHAVLGAGADACIVIDAPIEVLLRAIRGESLDFEALATQHEARQPRSNQHHAAADLLQVTAREREVLIGVAMGYSNKRIAGDLGRSVKTIENHRFKMMHKLGLRNTAAVTRYAMDHGLLDPDSSPPAVRPKN
jgi:DNA-binding NarL/FixJ family response regulator